MGTGPITDYSRENDGTGGGLHRSSLEMVCRKTAYGLFSRRPPNKHSAYFFYFLFFQRRMVGRFCEIECADGNEI